LCHYLWDIVRRPNWVLIRVSEALEEGGIPEPLFNFKVKEESGIFHPVFNPFLLSNHNGDVSMPDSNTDHLSIHPRSVFYNHFFWTFANLAFLPHRSQGRSPTLDIPHPSSEGFEPAVFHFERTPLAPILNEKIKPKSKIRKHQTKYEDGDVVGESAPEIDDSNKEE
jgi:hypothetical protein